MAIMMMEVISSQVSVPYDGENWLKIISSYLSWHPSRVWWPWLIPLRRPAFDAPAAKEMPFLLDVMPLAVGGPQFIPSLRPCFLSVARERETFSVSLSVCRADMKRKRSRYIRFPWWEKRMRREGPRNNICRNVIKTLKA